MTRMTTCLAVVLVGLITLLAAEGDGWTTLPVPGAWEEVGGDRFARHDGFAWYRCFVKVPAEWKGRDLELVFQHIDDADETFVNGEKVGSTGKLTPEGRSVTSAPRRYPVAARLVRPGQPNLLAVRVYDHGGRGGIRGPAPLLRSGQEAIRLDGTWQFRTGDDPGWSKWPDAKVAERFVAEARPAPGHRGAEEYEKLVREDARYNDALQGTQGLDEALRRLKAKLAETPPLSPREALAGFKVQDGLAVDLVAAEPTVRQPLWLTFDERGRMWVVQYLQYPFPAGLKVLSYDQYIRARFDKVPPPPPRHFKGADRITIHEDTDGDGTFDKVRTFAEGLNIATSVLPGRGGVWVLNPPY